MIINNFTNKIFVITGTDELQLHDFSSSENILIISSMTKAFAKIMSCQSE